MRIKNLTNSPYGIPLAGGGEYIVPAWGVSEDIEPQEMFLNSVMRGSNFWEILPDEENQDGDQDQKSTNPEPTTSAATDETGDGVTEPTGDDTVEGAADDAAVGDTVEGAADDAAGADDTGEGTAEPGVGNELQDDSSDAAGADDTGEGTAEPAAEATEVPDVSRMKKPELVEEANRIGIKDADNMTVAQLRGAILAKRG